ncbi:3-deoxy-D-manno-octulosonic-acid kinase [Actinobacillus equuli]|nr:3-deoxy-D-manno-octulosonic-acid kinase [Actinobacillus equuli]
MAFTRSSTDCAKSGKNMLLVSSRYHARKIEGTQDLSKYLQTHTLSDTQYQQIGKLIRQLHDHQVHHSDLNIHNILLEPTSGQFS